MMSKTTDLAAIETSTSALGSASCSASGSAADDRSAPASVLPRLLLVEDDETLRRSLNRILRAKYQIDEVSDGRLAAEVLKKEIYDVVLSDIGLPEINGVELLRLVRTYDVDVPIVLMTGQPTLETAIEAVDLGAFTYLRKPVDRSELEETLARAAKLGKLSRLKREAWLTMDEGVKLAGERRELSDAFDRALESLWLAYQPVVDSRTAEVVGYEALLRSGELSLAEASAVIAAAERLGRVHELGRVVRERAAAGFQPPNRNAMLFINLHAAELEDPQLYVPDSELARIAPNVILEITERVALEDTRQAQASASQLRKLGFRIAIDDLGTGYAGLSSFASLEPEVVKLDVSLVRGIDGSPMRTRVVESIIELCRSLNLKVVAEGVETQGEHDLLRQLGCDYLQGFMIGLPARFDGS